MITRYSTEEMEYVWGENAKFIRWLEIEAALNDVLQKHDVIPKNNLSEELRNIDVTCLKPMCDELEKIYRHDVLSFVFAAEKLCNDGRWIHYGLTSSDILDTSNAMAITQSLYIIENSLLQMCAELEIKKNKHSLCKAIGRTHGQWAEITTVGNIFQLFIDELLRNAERLNKSAVPGKLSGAVGNYNHISADIEKECLMRLGVTRTRTNQIVSRDYYAYLISNLTLLAGLVEKIALQIRLYQQSGISEMFEPFYAGQKGSSAMPHKRNPILCENLCGLARVIRGNLLAAMENISLWQERDISHSSAERIILPDTFNLVHFMIKRMTKIISEMEINEAVIQYHVGQFEASGNSDSQKEMLELIRNGHSRLEAYEIVQNRNKT